VVKVQRPAAATRVLPCWLCRQESFTRCPMGGKTTWWFCGCRTPTPTVDVIGTPNHLEGASPILATTTTSHGLEALARMCWSVEREREE
jgi:hypothetical protein